VLRRLKKLPMLVSQISESRSSPMYSYEKFIGRVKHAACRAQHKKALLDHRRND